MFKLDLSLAAAASDHAPPHGFDLPAFDAVGGSNSSTPRSLLDFNEDESSATSNPSSGDDEDDQLDLETMESVFDDSAKLAVIAYEQELNRLDEEWLAANKDTDADVIAQEMTDREIRKQHKLYVFRRKKFFELGGRKKTRNLMMRYGITHLKLLKEKHDDSAALGAQDAVETHPRAVANSLLHHLRYGDELLRIDWLKAMFRRLALQQRHDTAAMRFSSAPETEPAAAPPPLETLSNHGHLVVVTSPDDLNVPTEMTLLVADGTETLTSISGNNNDQKVSNSGVTPSSPQVPSSDVPSSDLQGNAYMKRAQQQRAQQQKSGENVVVDANERRGPPNSLNESTFVRGLRHFFDQLSLHDSCRRKLEQTRKNALLAAVRQLQDAINARKKARALRERRRTSVVSSDLSDASLNETCSDNEAEIDVTAMLNPADAANALKSAHEMENATAQRKLIDAVLKLMKSSEGEPRNPSSNDALEEFFPDHVHVTDAYNSPSLALHAMKNPSLYRLFDVDSPHDASTHMKEADGVVGGDFLSRNSDVIDAGYRFLYCAVDALDQGYIIWDQLVEYLLDATLQVKQAGDGDTQDENQHDYEFVSDHHTHFFSDLNDACMIPSRDMFVVAGTHVSIMSNRASQKFFDRGSIASPVDPFTLAPLYRVTAVANMASAKMLAVATSNSVVSIYAISSMTRPRFLGNHRIDSNARSLLWFKDLLFVGTREGTLTSFQLVRKQKGWGLQQFRQSHPHLSFVTRIVSIPTENCICSAGLDRRMILHDAKSLRTVFQFPPHHAQGIVDICYCDCINGIASVSFDNQILIWMVSLPNNKPISLIDNVRPHIGSVTCVVAIEHSRSLVTVDAKGMMKIWSLKALLCTQTVSVGHYVPISDAHAKFIRVFVHHNPPSAVLPLGSTQLFALSRRRLFVFEYNLSQRAVILRNTADDDAIVYVGYNYVEQLYITFSSRSVRVWEATTGAIRDSYRCAEVESLGGISAALLHPNGRSYFIGTHRGAIVSKNFSTGSTLYSVRCHSSPCIALRFCYAAVMPARVGPGAGTGGPVVAKAGLGDIVVSIADDSSFALTHDFKVKLPLDGIENARCLDHDSQSSLILIGDSFGAIHIYLQANLSSQRNLPYQILQFPKRMQREVTAITMLPGLSAFVAADDEGAMGLFSLKHHAKPFTCVGVWSHVTDNGSGGVTSLHFFPSKWLLYAGDELGYVVVYRIKDAFLLSQNQTISVGSDGSQGHSGRQSASPRAVRLGRGITPRHDPFGSPVSGRRRGMGGSTSFLSPSATTQLPVDYRTVGAAVILVNRFQPHQEPLTSMFVISPDNSGLTEMNESGEAIDDPVATHTVLLTTSVDQCCCSWTLSGTKHLGSLEQYGRCRVAITTPSEADDLDILTFHRDEHQLNARRDFIKTRSRGLIRKSMTCITSVVPSRIVNFATKQREPASASVLSARDAHFTPRTARSSRVQLDQQYQNAGALIMHPEVPLRNVMSTHEYHRTQNRQRKSLKQLAQNDFLPVTRSSIAALNAANAAASVTSSIGESARPSACDSETLSQMLSEYAHTDYNSIIDELFSNSVNEIPGGMSLKRNGSFGEASVSTSASAIVARDPAAALRRHQSVVLSPSKSGVDRYLGNSAGSPLRRESFQVTSPPARRDSSTLLRTTKSRASLGGRRASAATQPPQDSPRSCDDDPSNSSTQLLENSSNHIAVGPKCCSPSQGSVIPSSGRSNGSTSTSSRPVVIETVFIARSKTLRSADSPSSRKDSRLGYHTGTLETYRTVSSQPMASKFRLCTNYVTGRHETAEPSHGCPINPKEEVSRADAEHALALAEVNEAQPMTQSWLEMVLPPTPLRKRLIDLFLNFGPSLRASLFVECTSRNQSALLKQLVFSNKPLREIVSRDCIVEQKVPQDQLAAANLLYPPNRTREIFDVWDEFWGTYFTTMTPPPPEFLDRRIHHQPTSRKPPVPRLSAKTKASELGSTTCDTLISRVASTLRPSSAMSNNDDTRRTLTPKSTRRTLLFPRPSSSTTHMAHHAISLVNRSDVTPTIAVEFAAMKPHRTISKKKTPL